MSHQPIKKKDALKKYPVKLELRFENKDALQDFVGRYLDGGGEQTVGCYTESVTADGTWKTDSAWAWKEPMMFINVTPEDERDF